MVCKIKTCILKIKLDDLKMKKNDLAEIRVLHECGGISKIEISQITKDEFHVLIIKNNGDAFKLNTQRGFTRSFRTLDSAFKTVKNIFSDECIITVTGKK